MIESNFGDYPRRAIAERQLSESASDARTAKAHNRLAELHDRVAGESIEVQAAADLLITRL